MGTTVTVDAHVHDCKPVILQANYFGKIKWVDAGRGILLQGYSINCTAAGEKIK